MRKKTIRRQRKITFYKGDSRIVIKKITDNSVDSIVTDPPYALVSIVKRFGKKGSAPAKGNQAFVRASRGFMGKKWDTAETTDDPIFWAECLRVLKPGGHLISFGGTRTYHRMTCAIEDAGFEIRDMIQWLYGSGFPKSHDVSKGIDGKILHNRSDSVGLKRANKSRPGKGRYRTSGVNNGILGNKTGKRIIHDEPATKASKKWQGWGTALKPANEPMVLARKPLSEKTVAANVLKWGTGAINIDGCIVKHVTVAGGNLALNPHLRNSINGGNGGKIFPTEKKRRVVIPNVKGRWPANVITDGSDEVVAMFPESKGQQGDLKEHTKTRKSPNGIYGSMSPALNHTARNDSGSAARFFYQAKANKQDRAGSKHPTVKPINLLRYLIRLVTPLGGLILDPFAGSGTTAEAAMMEKCKVILIEREKEYQNDIKRRLQRMRTRQSRKRKK